MLRRLTTALATSLLAAAMMFAHGAPMIGTVTEVKSDNFTVKDLSNKTIVIMLMKDTKFVMNKKTVTKAELKVGVRVSMDAEMDDKMKMYRAYEIDITPAPATTKTLAAPAAGASKAPAAPAPTKTR